MVVTVAALPSAAKNRPAAIQVVPLRAVRLAIQVVPLRAEPVVAMVVPLLASQLVLLLAAMLAATAAPAVAQAANRRAAVVM